MMALLRRAAVAVGEALGHAYPHDLHRQVAAYLQKVQHLDRQASALA